MTEDLPTDVDFWMSNRDNGGKVHRGFQKALDDIQTDLFDYKDLARSGENCVSRPIPEAIRDHVPLFYAVLLWNNLVAGWDSSTKNEVDP